MLGHAKRGAPPVDRELPMFDTFARRSARTRRQSSRGRWPRVGSILRSFARAFRRSGGYTLRSPYPVNSVLTDAAQFEALGCIRASRRLFSEDFGVLPYSPIQHGAHDEWARRNDPFYAGGVNMWPLPGVIHFRPGEKPRHVSTVAHYRDILASLGQERVYSAEAWDHGRNRLAAVRYVRRNSSPTPEEPTSTRL